MSFLNPVNEPVLRFKSTDASAPQINYNSRVAGDVKAVLKACLVTGYGATASAGWTAANEVGNTIEFVSPSAAMSDYRLGLDDTSTSSTIWYYQYQDARTNPNGNALTKSFSSVNKSSANNGWQLLVSKKGLVLIEIVELTANTELATRVTYWGAIKSAVNITNGTNIAYWSVGANAPSQTPSSFFSNNTTNAHYRIGTLTKLRMAAVNLQAVIAVTAKTASSIELLGDIFIETEGGSLVAKQPAVLLKTSVKNESIFGLVEKVMADGRPTLSVCVPYPATDMVALINYAVNLTFYTDYWEY